MNSKEKDRVLFVWYLNMNHHRLIVVCETGRWQKTVDFLEKHNSRGFLRAKTCQTSSCVYTHNSLWHYPGPQHELSRPSSYVYPTAWNTCHKEAEKSEGGEKDKCSRGKRRGQPQCDKQADWHQPHTGLLSAAAVSGTLRALFVFCWWKIQDTSCLDIL